LRALSAIAISSGFYAALPEPCATYPTSIYQLVAPESCHLKASR
jgi:hypothetical protein